MATKSQVVAMMSRALRVPFYRLLVATDRLRLAGQLPSAQGAVVDLEPNQITLIIIAALLGEAASDPRNVVTFAELRDAVGTFREALAGLLTNPDTLVRLHIDGAGSAMIVTDEGAHHFGQPDADAVSRVAVVDGAVWRQLSTDIMNAPRLKAGRPPKD